MGMIQFKDGQEIDQNEILDIRVGIEKTIGERIIPPRVIVDKKRGDTIIIECVTATEAESYASELKSQLNL